MIMTEPMPMFIPMTMMLTIIINDNDDANANDGDMPLLQPSSWMVTHTKLALGLPLAASLGGAGGLLGLGLCCLAASLWRRRRASK